MLREATTGTGEGFVLAAKLFDQSCNEAGYEAYTPGRAVAAGRAYFIMLGAAREGDHCKGVMPLG